MVHRPRRQRRPVRAPAPARSGRPRLAAPIRVRGSSYPPSRGAGHLQWFCMRRGRIFGDAVGLREAASIVFALAALLPLLVPVLALHRSGALWSFEAEAMVLVALATAVIGFIVFRVMVDRVLRLASSLVGAAEAGGRDADTALVAGVGRGTETGQTGTAIARFRHGP